LTALVALEFFNALFSQLNLRGAKTLVNISLVFMVVISVWSLAPIGRKWSKPKFFFAILIVFLMVIDSSIESDRLAPFQMGTMFLFIGITIYFSWQQVMFTGEITRNTIFGSICIYILIGLLFGFAFLIVESILPGSLVGLNGDSWQDNLQITIYYSMVTLTTLGYGDISPAAPVARFLAYMEAMFGVFYTTVLVASLIGLRLSSQRTDNSTESDH
jgi:hypothetical protein